MAAVGFVADVDREIAAGEAEIAVAAGGPGVAAAVVAAADDLVQLAAGAEPAVAETASPGSSTLSTASFRKRLAYPMCLYSMLPSILRAGTGSIPRPG